MVSGELGMSEKHRCETKDPVLSSSCYEMNDGAFYFQFSHIAVPVNYCPFCGKVAPTLTFPIVGFTGGTIWRK